MPSLSLAFINAHRALVALVPHGFHALLPTLPTNAPDGPRSIDYTKFIQWLELPRFAPANPAHNWAGVFAQAIPQDSRRPVVCRLVELIEFGAQPRDRRSDLQTARWELPIRPGSTLPPAAPTGVWRDENSAPGTEFPSVRDAMERFRTGAQKLRQGEWNDESILKLLGYSVGRSGPPASKRHTALEACFFLPDTAIPMAQREAWGARCSRHRVRKMSRMIEFFLSLAEKNTHRDLRESRNDWRDDLQWISQRWPGA